VFIVITCSRVLGFKYLFVDGEARAQLGPSGNKRLIEIGGNVILQQ
jgi:hypothetical protein